MLQFVEGTSGSGKTDTIRHMLMEKAKNRGKRSCCCWCRSRTHLKTNERCSA